MTASLGPGNPSVSGLKDYTDGAVVSPPLPCSRSHWIATAMSSGTSTRHNGPS